MPTWSRSRPSADLKLPITIIAGPSAVMSMSHGPTQPCAPLTGVVVVAGELDVDERVERTRRGVQGDQAGVRLAADLGEVPATYNRLPRGTMSLT